MLNNLLLSAATAAVLFGTLFPLIAEAFGRAVSVGPFYFNLVFGGLMAVALLILPAGPLLAWKRGELSIAAQRLWLAAVLALAFGAGVLFLAQPHKAAAAAGVALGALARSSAPWRS